MITNKLSHLAIIMDGNGRWAEMRGLPRNVGHEHGVKSLKDIVKYCIDNSDIEYLTVFAFSVENNLRPKSEVVSLFELIERNLRKELVNLYDDGVKIQVIGDKGNLSSQLQQSINHVEQLTADNRNLTLSIAINYSGKWDILQAVNKHLNKEGSSSLDLKDIDENLSTFGIPNPDLLIRTGNEMRISNFLLWQISYTELYFSDKLWPDFGTDDLLAAFAHYSRRERKFGKLEENAI